MTDKEKAELELSLSLIDQAIATEQTTKSTKDLNDAIDIEVDASLNLTNSKEKITDQMQDLEYSLSEQNKAEKQYLNALDRRLEIERKIGLIDYQQIDKNLHDKIVGELEQRLKREQEKNKSDTESDKKDEDSEKTKRKSESDYLKQAEEMHKKRKGVFQRISEGHKNYMSNSSSLAGRIAMGALGKGTSELMSAIDSATDAIPGGRQVKQVGGFIRDQYREAKERKRQEKIQDTAKFLREKDNRRPPETSEEKKQRDNQKQGTKGIFKLGDKLDGITKFLKGMLETMTFMNILKGVLSFLSNPITLLITAIGTALAVAFKNIDLKKLLTDIRDFIEGVQTKISEFITTFKNGVYKLARKLGIELPDSWAPLDEQGNIIETPEEAQQREAIEDYNNIPDTGVTFGPKSVQEAQGNKEKSSATFSGNSLANAAQSSLDTKLATEDSSFVREKQLTDEELLRLDEQQIKSINEEAKKLYEDPFDNSVPIIGEDGKIQLHPNPDNNEDIKFANERRYQFAMGEIDGTMGSETDFRELQKQADAKRDAEMNQQNASSVGVQANNATSNTTINNNSTPNKLFGFSPWQHTSTGTESRGAIK